MAETEGQDPTAEGQDPTPETETPPEERTYTAAEVKALRDEAAAHRRKLRDAEARLKELDDAKLSEGEKLAARLKELEEQNARLARTTRLAEVKAAAAAAGAHNPAAVARLIDEDAEDVGKALESLRKSDAYLFARPGAGSADGGTRGTPNLTDMNALIRRRAGRA